MPRVAFKSFFARLTLLDYGMSFMMLSLALGITLMIADLISRAN